MTIGALTGQRLSSMSPMGELMDLSYVQRCLWPNALMWFKQTSLFTQLDTRS